MILTKLWKVTSAGAAPTSESAPPSRRPPAWVDRHVDYFSTIDLTQHTVAKHSVSRRSFLKASALAGGGLVLGFSLAPKLREAAGAPSSGTHDINAYLTISTDGQITIYSANPEIGQNVKTSMPMIVADELDADWSQVRVVQAGLDTSKYRRQLAGGSQSIRQGWQTLRQAGATARQMLIEAAANRLGVPTAELTTAGGIITHQASGRTLTYGEVAQQAASVPVPNDVPLKQAGDFSIIGTSRRNVDARGIVTGAPLFGIDIEREGMLIAMIEHAPGFGMRLRSMAAEAARAMPGITDIFIIDASVPERQWSDVNAFTEKVVVVGTSTWEVLQAKRALVLEWESDGTPESTEMHEAQLTGLLDGDSNVQVGRRDGDPETAFAQAARIIERTYSAPLLAHNTLEPMNFFAHVQGNRAELAGPVQTPASLRRSVASACDLPEENISIDLTRMGGGFGRRLYGNFAVEAAVISQRMQAPIKLLYTREDDLTQGTYRPSYKVRYRAGLDENGNLVAFAVRGAGINESPVFANRFPAGAVDHYLAELVFMDSDVTTGAWRAPRSNFIAGAEQSFLDEVARAAGKDPIDFRLALFERAMARPVGDDHDYEAARFAGVLKLVRERSGWDGASVPGLYRGVSVYYCHNSYVAQVLDLTMSASGPIIEKVWCAIDCGIVINPDAARNQVEGGIVDGIGHAMYSGLTIADGRPEQTNFHTYRLIRMNEAPRAIETFFVDNGIDPTGLGEPSLPPVSGALANAYFEATGTRLSTQPFIQTIEQQPPQG